MFRDLPEVSDIDPAELDELVERVATLDGWLTRGGYLPAAWAREGCRS